MLSLILNIPWIDFFFQNNLHGSLTQRFNINSEASGTESEEEPQREAAARN